MIGKEKIIRNLPTIDSLRSFASQAQTHETIDEFFLSIPNQTFLLNYLEIFPLLVDHVFLEAQQLPSTFQIFRSILSTPISKDVSPFLVPSLSDAIMTTVQRQTIKCLSCLITTDYVFDINSANPQKLNATSNLMDKSEITNLHKTLQLHSLSLFDEIFKELLLYASYSWSPNDYQSVLNTSSVSLNKAPLVMVYMSPFGLSCLALAVQLLRSNTSHDDHVTDQLITTFIKVRH